jgi:hypothetical protein
MHPDGGSPPHKESNDPSSPPARDAGSPRDRGVSADEGSAWSRALRDVAPYLDLGWRLAGTTAFPPLLGFGLDLWLQTTPWMLLGGCAVGLLGAVLQLRRLRGEASY